MTDQEFRRLIDHNLANAFPGTREWLSSLDNLAGVLSVWKGELADLSYSRASDAIREIHEGREPAPAAYERECWPGFIRRAVARATSADREHEKRFSLPDAKRRDRYACLTCRDIGFVMCWHPISMGAARRKEPVKRLSVAVPCTCNGGDKWATIVDRRGAEKGQRPTYDKDRWVRLSGDWERDEQDLASWADSYQPPNWTDFGEYNG